MLSELRQHLCLSFVTVSLGIDQLFLLSLIPYWPVECETIKKKASLNLLDDPHN